jgi:serine/threonine-protein kinase
VSQTLPPGFEAWTGDSKYELRGTLGAGAMGVVLDGFDRAIERRVAIKVVRKPAAEDAEAIEAAARFKREAQAAGRLSHPGIVAVYDYGENDETAWIVMEMVSGGTLKAILDRNERLPVKETARIMIQVLNALAYAHARGVIHRDIKPANVMLTAEGDVKLADFGIARLENSAMTQVGTLMGTPSYMAPEQLRGEALDARADIWAAGVMLYQLLTGEKPFPGGFSAVMHKVLHTEPVPPSALSATSPPALDAVVMKALAKRPDDRWPDAKAFAAAIEAALNAPAPTLTVPAEDATMVSSAPQPAVQAPGATPAAPTAPKAGGRPGWLLPAAGAGIVAAAGVAGFLFWAREAPRPAPAPAPPILTAPPSSVPPASLAAGPSLIPPPTAPSLTQPPPAPAAPSLAESAPAPQAPSQTTSASPPTSAPPPSAPVHQEPPALAQPAMPTQPPASAMAQAMAPGAVGSPPSSPVPAPPAQTAPVAPGQTAQAMPTTPSPPRDPLPAGSATSPAANTQIVLAPAPRFDWRAIAAAATAAAPCGLLGVQVEENGFRLRGVLPQEEAESLRREVAAHNLPPGAARLELGSFTAPYCPLVRALRPAVASPAEAPSVAVDGSMPLRKGSLLRFSVQMPPWANHLHVAYATSDGSVARLEPGAAQPPGARVRLGDQRPGFQGWEIDEPFGTDLLFVVVSDGPLFPAGTPAMQAEGAYAEGFTTALQAARAAGRRVALTPVVVDTAAR